MTVQKFGRCAVCKRTFNWRSKPRYVFAFDWSYLGTAHLTCSWKGGHSCGIYPSEDVDTARFVCWAYSLRFDSASPMHYVPELLDTVHYSRDKALAWWREGPLKQTPEFQQEILAAEQNLRERYERELGKIGE